MTAKSTQLVMAGLVLATLLMPVRARAIEVKKMLPPPAPGAAAGGGGGGGGGEAAPAAAKSNPIPKAMQAQLNDKVSQEYDQYLDEESEKKSEGKTYVDLEHAKPVYFPSQKDGKWIVQAKLEAAELQAPKDGSGPGRATGKRKALVFNYRLDGNSWTETEPPKWEDVEKAAAKKK
ncbi:MAG TPA: hypothetical protein VEC38_13845 [Candidatus Binataceae bacterium]|nr:hypothetical protein [Candidatus Binataceae bacterium]